MAVGIAEALDYLHNGSAQPVIHRDVKSSNILLTDDFEPQVIKGQFISLIYFFFEFVITYSISTIFISAL